MTDTNTNNAQPVLSPPQVRGCHRQVRSGATEQSDSLFGSLADVMEVLTIIDEVEAIQ